MDMNIIMKIYFILLYLFRYLFTKKKKKTNNFVF